MDNIEMRFCEVRAEGRTLTGTAIKYGDTATFAWGQERIEPNAFAPLGDAILNAQHDRTTPLARTDGGGLTLLDSARPRSKSAPSCRRRDPPTMCWNLSGRRSCAACLSSLCRSRNDPTRMSE